MLYKSSRLISVSNQVVCFVVIKLYKCVKYIHAAHILTNLNAVFAFFFTVTGNSLRNYVGVTNK